MSVLYFLIEYLSHGYQLREKYAKQYVPGNDVQKSALHWSGQSVCQSHCQSVQVQEMGGEGRRGWWYGAWGSRVGEGSV